MKTTLKTGLILTSFALAFAVLMTSCKKKETETPDTDTQAVADNNTAEWIANDAITMGGQASETGSVSYRQTYPNSVLATCATVTVDVNAKKITVNFPGGICSDGHIRQGTLLFDYSGSAAGANVYRNPGFKCVLTSQNYMVDGNNVTINHTVTNTTPANFSSPTNLTWAVTATVTVVKAGNGGTITWNCNRTHTLLNTYPFALGGINYGAAYTDQNTVIQWNPIQGQAVPSAAIIGVSGTANGTTAKGESYSFATTSQLVVNMNCTPDANKPSRHPIVQGAFDFTPGNKGTRHVDFGSGTCDMICTVTISANGKTYGPYQVTLP
jgi:hypothetical protein